MNKKAVYKIIEDINVVVEYYSGSIFIEDMIDLKTNLFSEKSYHPKINIIMDLRDAYLEIKEPDICKYIEFAEENIEFIGKRKVAFFTSTPNHVALCLLFECIKSHLPMIPSTFSTIESIISWLEIAPNELGRILTTLKSLSK